MKKTFKTVERFLGTNTFLNFLDIPGSDYFRIEVVNSLGSEIEKDFMKNTGINVYGVSHLCEHLAFKSTLDYSTSELLYLLKNKGTYNASTDTDRINYWYKTISDNHEIAIKLVCNIAFNDFTKLDNDEFETEKKVVVNEIKRYQDDDQTMFHFNTGPLIYNLHKDDTILGDYNVIENIDLETILMFRSEQLNKNHRYFINITYDSTKISQSYITELLTNNLSRFNFRTSKRVYIQNYQLVDSGKYYLSNDSEQSMTNICFKAPFIYTASMGLSIPYISSYAKDKSLSDYIREKHGLTYGISFNMYNNYDEYINFSCDVEKGNEDFLLSLFKKSINDIYNTFTQDDFNNFKTTYKLKDKMGRFNFEKYNMLFNTFRLRYTYFKTLAELLKNDVDNALDIEIDSVTYESMKHCLYFVKEVVNKDGFVLVSNRV